MTITNRAFTRIVLAAMALGVLLLVVAGIAAVFAAQNNRLRAAWVVHTFEVERQLDHLTIAAEQLETARRGFLLWHRPNALTNAHARMRDIPHTIDVIQYLTQDNALQQVRMPALRADAQALINSAQTTIDREQSANPALRAMADFSTDASYFSMQSVRARIKAMYAEEERLFRRRTGAQDNASFQLYAVLGVVGLLIIIIMGAAFWVILRYTADLNRAQDALKDLNTGLEGAVAVRTAELSRANEEIQRFAYIVSHDLRSPLVNVMGFTAELETTIEPLATLIDRVDAEAPALMTSEARDAKTDLPEAIGFIRTSTAKMDRLINSILRLSREGRRTLLPAKIDLGEMTGAIRDSFAHRIAETGTAIDVGGPFPPLVSDRLALEQILSNLVENAVKYLKPGVPGRVAVTARRDGGRVVIDVVDNGRGIAPGDHERIFELFRRSGVQDQPGEGLGLAHVRALAYRLGGVITCISSLGEGATFRLSLPQTLEVEAREGAVR